ncbi:MAG TPA: TadE/TadG family type IV pilus assembly protein [Kineosporiaceae bacterium]
MESHACGSSPRQRQDRTARPANDRGGRDRGAVAVEFALLFPLLFFLLFGTLLVGWRVWEAQAGQATAREAARIAGFGVADTDSYGHTVVCLAERSGLRPGSVTSVSISFLDPTLTSTAPSEVGGYVRITLAYRSALGAVPLFDTGDGTLTASAVSRIEQPAGLLSDTTVAEGGTRCR